MKSINSVCLNKKTVNNKNNFVSKTDRRNKKKLLIDTKK